MGKKITSKIFRVTESALTEHELSFVDEGCRFYFNAQHKYVQLSTLERCYFDYMCERMNARNVIELSPRFREEFVAFYEKVTGKSNVRTGRSLQNVEMKLKNLYLIFNTSFTTGVFYVNPKHVFKGTTKDRTKLLRQLSSLAFTDEEIHKAITDVSIDSLTPIREVQELEFPTDFVPFEEKIIGKASAKCKK